MTDLRERLERWRDFGLELKDTDHRALLNDTLNALQALEEERDRFDDEAERLGIERAEAWRERDEAERKRKNAYEDFSQARDLLDAAERERDEARAQRDKEQLAREDADSHWANIFAQAKSEAENLREALRGLDGLPARLDHIGQDGMGNEVNEALAALSPSTGSDDG